ncbi:neuronal acetylcholine receptor subunit beta-3-like [Haliotis rubra]|uniref:neuronal acetylcholine receptor subunit beta-3-like n=1 Tax=Haliotis rubra TaxID=36100 RepID=UPI001EE54BDF|nr:neuronal acetylcholine receptor subunit beta-3-like [Haliotis rubra]
MVLLSILNSFVFLLPADSGEKISFLVSIFVTYAVFLNFVSDLIPKSDRLPRLVVYLVLVQCHSTLCILATLFILNRHHKKDNDDAKEKARRNRNQDENQYANEDMHQEHCQSNTGKNISVHSRITPALSFKTVERSLFFAFLVLAAATLLVLFV